MFLKHTLLAQTAAGWVRRPTPRKMYDLNIEPRTPALAYAPPAISKQLTYNLAVQILEMASLVRKAAVRQVSMASIMRRCSNGIG